MRRIRVLLIPQAPLHSLHFIDMRTSQRQRKKQDEAHYFERAQALLSCWPPGQVDASGEQPDIIIDALSGRYGVEVTWMLRDDLRKVEETRRKICETAHRRLLAIVPALGLRVAVNFLAHGALNPRAISDAADELAGIVESHLAGPLTEKWGGSLESGEDFESRLFAKVWLHHLPESERSIWQPANASWVPVASIEDVRTAIERKEEKVAAYRRRAPTIWLLIVVQGFSGSSAWSVDDEVTSHFFRSSFDGIVLLDYAMNKAHVLNLVPRG